MKNTIKGNFVGFTNGDPTITNSKVTIKEMTNNKQKTNPENPNNQFSNSEPMTFAQKVDYVKNIDMTNNKQQTAVEWLAENMWEHIEYKPTLEIQRIRKKIQQAKEMEKEQHGKTWDKSMDNLDSRGGNMVRAWVDFDEHYNETYGGGEQ